MSIRSRRGTFTANAFKSIDAFGKTFEDVKIRTTIGASLTFVSITLIVLLTLIEFIDYRSIYLDTDIEVHKGINDHITANFNVTFPRVPCFLISLDATDLSGEHMREINHDVKKIRLDNQGVPFPDQENKFSELDNELSRVVKQKKPDYCGSCHGGALPKGGCCQTCEDVRQAYLEKGWSFANPDTIEQCIAEGWTDRMNSQAKDGCQVVGRIRLRKVTSSISFSFGKSYLDSTYHSGELMSYLTDSRKHDFGHYIEWLRFEADEEYHPHIRRAIGSVKEKLGIAKDPLNGRNTHHGDRFTVVKSSRHQYMFQYFVQVVNTAFHTLDDHHVVSNQYSFSQHTRDVGDPWRTKNEEGLEVTHNYDSQPGVFFNIDVSPMEIVHTEKRKPFAYFLTTFCGIVGGILTAASLIDAALFQFVQNK